MVESTLHARLLLRHGKVYLTLKVTITSLQSLPYIQSYYYIMVKSILHSNLLLRHGQVYLTLKVIIME